MTSTLLRSPDEEVRRAGVAALRQGELELSLVVEALGDDSWRVRKEAVLRAAGWDDRERAAQALVDALAEPDNVGRRNAVIEALARIGGPAVPPLVAALDARLPHRKLVVDTLGLIADRRAAPALVPTLGDEDPNVRAAAAESLGRMGGPVAEAALVQALAGGELLVSIAALAALHHLGVALPVAAITPLLDVPVRRPAALGALGASRDPVATPVLAGYLADRSPGVREAATAALDRLASTLDEAGRLVMQGALRELPAEAFRELVEALLEASPGTRRAAATVLGLTGAPEAVRPLVLALGDPEVEEAAAQALAGMGEAALPPLVDTIAESDGERRLAIFRLLPTLAGAADARLQALLVSAIDDDDSEAAGEALRALGAVGGAEAGAPLLAALERPDRAAAAEEALALLAGRHPAELRSALVAAGFHDEEAAPRARLLAACGQAADGPLLSGLLGHPSPGLRAAAAEALARLLGERSFSDLAGALTDPAPEVRAAVARVVAEWPSGQQALRARAPVEDDPLVRAVMAAALARPA